jgi:hypothetical protein
MTEDRHGPLKQTVTVTETVLTVTTIVPNYVKSSVLNFLKILQGSYADTRREADGHIFAEMYSSKALSKIAKNDYCLLRVCLSVRSAWNNSAQLGTTRHNSAPIGRISVKFDI